MATPTATYATAATTGAGFTLNVRPYVAPTTPVGAATNPNTSTATYTPCPWITKITPAKRSTDGAEDTLLSPAIKTELPTVPGMIESGCSMQVVEGDAGYTMCNNSCRTFPLTYLDFVMVDPLGNAKQFIAWIKEWTPSDLTVGDVRMVDMTFSHRTPTVYGTMSAGAFTANSTQ